MLLLVPPCLVLHLVVVLPLADDLRHPFRHHHNLHHIQVSHNYSLVGIVDVIDIREVQSVYLPSSRPHLELFLRFPESQIVSEGEFRLFRHPLLCHGSCDVRGDDDVGDGDVVLRAPQVPLECVFDVFRPQRVIDFFVDDARYILRVIDFFPETFHSSQLQATTLLCGGFFWHQNVPRSLTKFFVKKGSASIRKRGPFC